MARDRPRSGKKLTQAALQCSAGHFCCQWPRIGHGSILFRPDRPIDASRHRYPSVTVRWAPSLFSARDRRAGYTARPVNSFESTYVRLSSGGLRRFLANLLSCHSRSLRSVLDLSGIRGNSGEFGGRVSFAIFSNLQLYLLKYFMVQQLNFN